MLFILDSSIVNDLESGSEDAMCVLQKLANARRSGKHLIYASRGVFNALANSPNLDEITRGVYHKILSNLPTSNLKKYKEQFSLCFRIIGSQNKKDSPEKNILDLSVEYLSDNSFDETIFLAENLDDIKFYKFIAKIYKYFNELKNLELNFFEICGGGDTIGNQYKSIQQQEDKFCLCLCDSDIDVPGSSLGTTAAKVKKYDDPSKPLCKAEFLQVREIENLIPIAFLELLLIEKDEFKERVEKLKDILNNEEVIEKHPNILKYIDLKKGIALGKSYNKIKNKPTFFQYWNSIVESYGCPIEFESCFNNQECSEGKVEKCMCIILPGFNNKILEHILNKVIDKNDLETLASLIKQDINLIEEWNSLGTTITSWGCGGNKMRVI